MKALFYKVKTQRISWEKDLGQIKQRVCIPKLQRAFTNQQGKVKQSNRKLTKGGE